ncbi:peptide chain release factor 1 [Candidatus Parvarchaeota archaeon]|uniref:Peptide chain release factor 1 n=1 Tax=Candidatus Acidifodinimicrobium mancum TaxID=2898728 RepID=A0A8T3V009_9ARCH|nr:peptide chain release factor 1 [Candidatus Acidifodinimicrobium mancum]MBE5728740.1 peptide chain release factor 1 [Candidatus Acidifodinimicrobium mancum]
MDKKEYEALNVLKYLEGIKGRHTELISVYIPAGFSLDIIRNHLAEERNTASNIKDRNNRKNVITALDKVINELKLVGQTPPNGLVVFCGNVSDKEGEPDIRLWSLEPPERSDIRIYRCDQQFVTQPLKQMFNKTNVYGLLVMDNREATIGILDGSNVSVLKHIKSLVPGKFSKGGQSAMRFTREREGLIRDFYKEIGETAKDLLSDKGMVGLIVGGPGPAKDNFIEGGFLPSTFKVLGTRSVGDADQSGLDELIDKSKDILVNVRRLEEREYVQKLLGSIARNDRLSVYGENETINQLESDNVDTLLISDGVDEKKKNDLYYRGSEKGINVEIISMNSSDGLQLYNLGGVAALLKRPSKS